MDVSHCTEHTLDIQAVSESSLLLIMLQGHFHFTHSILAAITGPGKLGGPPEATQQVHGRVLAIWSQD